MRDGKPQYPRRRLCAREFRWLDGSREGLFSPATSADIIVCYQLSFFTASSTPTQNTASSQHVCKSCETSVKSCVFLLLFLLLAALFARFCGC